MRRFRNILVILTTLCAVGFWAGAQESIKPEKPKENQTKEEVPPPPAEPFPKAIQEKLNELFSESTLEMRMERTEKLVERIVSSMENSSNQTEQILDHTNRTLKLFQELDDRVRKLEQGGGGGQPEIHIHIHNGESQSPVISRPPTFVVPRSCPPRKNEELIPNGVNSWQLGA